MFYPLECGVSIILQLFEIFLHRRCVSFPLFIQSLFTSVDSCLFHTLGYNPVLLNFVAQIGPDLAFGSLFNWLLSPSDIFPSLCVFLLLLSTYFLVVYVISDSSRIFPAPVLN